MTINQAIYGGCPSRQPEIEFQWCCERLTERLLAFFRAHSSGTLQMWMSPDDLLQETWIAVWGSMESMLKLPVDRWDGWIRCIALRKLQDARRCLAGTRFARVWREHASEGGSLQGLMKRAESKEREPEEDALRRERDRLLQEGMRSLPEDESLVLRLRFLLGQDWPQVAAALRRTPSAAQALSYRARARLRQLLPRSLARPELNGPLRGGPEGSQVA